MVPLIRHIIPRYRVLFSWEIMNTNALVRLLVLQFVQGLVFIVSLSITVSYFENGEFDFEERLFCCYPSAKHDLLRRKN